jgi:hypothetical protein
MALRCPFFNVASEWIAPSEGGNAAGFDLPIRLEVSGGLAGAEIAGGAQSDSRLELRR